MKTFFTTLAGILVAAAIILTGLYAKLRIDQWEMAKGMSCALIHSENAASELVTKGNQERMRMDALYAQNQADILRMVSQNSANITALHESEDRIVELDRRLLWLLENKPFGLPLTAQERGDLDAIKTELAKNQ